MQLNMFVSNLWVSYSQTCSLMEKFDDVEFATNLKVVYLLQHFKSSV